MPKKNPTANKFTTIILIIILSFISILTLLAFYFSDKVTFENSENIKSIMIKSSSSQPYKYLYCVYGKYNKSCSINEALQNATTLVGGKTPIYTPPPDLTETCGIPPYDKLKLPSVEDFSINGPKWSPDCQKLIYHVAISGNYTKDLTPVKGKEGFYLYYLKTNSLQKLNLEKDCSGFNNWVDENRISLGCLNEEFQSHGQFIYDTAKKTFDTPQM